MNTTWATTCAVFPATTLEALCILRHAAFMQELHLNRLAADIGRGQNGVDRFTRPANARQSAEPNAGHAFIAKSKTPAQGIEQINEPEREQDHRREPAEIRESARDFLNAGPLDEPGEEREPESGDENLEREFHAVPRDMAGATRTLCSASSAIQKT